MLRVKKIGGGWTIDYSVYNESNAGKIFWIESNISAKFDIEIYIDDKIIDAIDGPGDQKIAWLRETRELNKEAILALLRNIDGARAKFALILTFLDELLELGPPFRRCLPETHTWIARASQRIYPKTRLVSMIASSKDFLAGHRRRLEWVEILRNKVDLYGRGRERELEHKVDGLRDYMFTVAIENDDSASYFTEKLLDAFMTGTVPVYWGSRSAVEQHFDARGIIFLDDDPTLSTLSAQRYAEMAPHIEENFRRAVNIPGPEAYIYEEYLRHLQH